MAEAIDLFTQALALPEKERAKLAQQLLETLTTEEPMTEAEGTAKLHHRVDAVLDHGSNGTPWDEVYAEARKRLAK